MDLNVMRPQFTTMRIEESSQVGDARRRLGTLAEQGGFDEVAMGNAAIVVTELATNLVKHAQEGELLFALAPPSTPGGPCPGLDLWAIDRGPGVADPDEWLRDGYSTAGTRGAGMGAIRRLSTAFQVYSHRGKGTVQYLRLPPSKELVPGSSFFRRPASTVPISVAGLNVPVAGETVCGDGWTSRRSEGRLLVLVADGLGHGPLAHLASDAAVAVVDELGDRGPVEILQAAHQALLPTRGAAVAVAEIDVAAGRIRFAGIGNIGAFVSTGGKTQRMVSVNGVVGVPPFRGRLMEYTFTNPATVVLFSDGLQSQVRLDGYERLSNNDPAVIAGVLYRDFRRGRDDATAVVACIGKDRADDAS